MKHFWRWCLPVVACAIAVPGLAGASGGVKPGDVPPPLTLTSADGKCVSLTERKGRVVLVDFWASWCGPCVTSFPAIDALYRELHDRGFDVVAINVDEQRGDANAFLADKSYAMTVVFDPEGRAPDAFGVAAMPSSYVIGRDGRVRFVHVGYNGKTLDQYRREIESLLAETGANQVDSPV
jgi:thiol-disulfide isomerase/thioredoxin